MTHNFHAWNFKAISRSHFFVLFLYILICHYKFVTAKEVDSSSKLIASKWSNLGEDNLDIDGGGQARGELPAVVFINELGMFKKIHYYKH